MEKNVVIPQKVVHKSVKIQQKVVQKNVKIFIIILIYNNINKKQEIFAFKKLK